MVSMSLEPFANRAQPCRNLSKNPCFRSCRGLKKHLVCGVVTIRDNVLLFFGKELAKMVHDPAGATCGDIGGCGAGPVPRRMTVRDVRRILAFCCVTALGGLIGGVAALAQQPKPAGMTLAEAAERRFPQPVRVGDLVGRRVLQPLESQPTLGWVRAVVKQPDGTIDVVVDYGGFFGLFGRPIAVPVDGMVLLGQYMEIVDFSPQQLDQFKMFAGGDTSALPPDSVIRVGLARPSH
jgi:hypothetical protein